jgi:methyltransferase
MMVFWLFLCLLILQRALELLLARKNENWMKSKGAVEFGMSHYPWMVVMHIGFFSMLILEVTLLGRSSTSFWPLWLSLFFAAQAARVWVIASLGRYWNTKIIVLPDSDVTKKGPYKYVKHPNYMVVAAEIIVISLLFNAYITGILFSLLNVWMMAVRIPEEENALKSLTEYEIAFSKKSDN